MTSRNDVLLRWQTEEATMRARLAAPGVASPQDVKASSGIEFLQRIFNGELPSPPIGETLGFVPIAAEPGRVVFQGTPDKRHYNPLAGLRRTQRFLRLDKRKQFLIDLAFQRRAHAMRSALVDLQGGALNDLRRKHRRIRDRHDLVVVISSARLSFGN
jgi:hypothetical protein